MRILVFSDTHGDPVAMLDAIRLHSDAEYIIHCGDSVKELDDVRRLFPEKQLIAVRGNCDFSSPLNITEAPEIGGKKFFITHGHAYKVKMTMYNLVCAARDAKADVLLFGHTHIPMTDYDDGLYIMNPGSCHRGYMASYGFVDITDKGDIVTQLVKVK